MADLPPEDQPDTIDIGPVRGIPIIEDDDPRFVEERAAWSAARAKAQAMHSPDELLAGLTDEDYMVRHEVLPRLVVRGRGDPRTGPAVIAAATRDPAWQVRDLAVVYLPEYGAAAVSAIREALADNHAEVRESARYALAQCVEDD